MNRLDIQKFRHDEPSRGAVGNEANNAAQVIGAPPVHSSRSEEVASRPLHKKSEHDQTGNEKDDGVKQVEGTGNGISRHVPALLNRTSHLSFYDNSELGPYESGLIGVCIGLLFALLLVDLLLISDPVIQQICRVTASASPN